MPNSLQRDHVLKQAFKFQHALTAYAYGMVRDHARAEDIVQNSFLVIIDKYDQFQEGTSILSWCRSIVRFKALEEIRRFKKTTTMEDEALTNTIDELFQSRNDTLHANLLNKRFIILQDCLKKLPEKSRHIIEQNYLQNKRSVSIAEELGMKIEAIKKSLFRIKKKLKECVLRGEGALEV
ncbi:MAG: sigma-70 family RNA polymerase sigma factor [Planctomycetes bacterium]|nr:sigma-70 family RNA polymerase sigma factor [Planctomycetota bacterium]